ncbi:MAG: hypothetical protein ACMXYE_02835 [Candidatus Woesearchaeota archaeon]
MEDLTDLKKLSPDERAKKLKELIDKHTEQIEATKKKLEEAQHLQKKSEEEHITKVLQQREEELEEEEQLMQELIAQTSSLDERIADIVPSEDAVEQFPEEHQPIQYFTGTSSSEDLYQTAVSLYQDVDGSIAPDVAAQAGNIVYALAQKTDDISKGEYDASEEIRRQADSAFAIAEKILSIYTGGVKRRPPGQP